MMIGIEGLYMYFTNEQFTNKRQIEKLPVTWALR